MAAKAPALAPDTVAEELRADDTRGRTLDALDKMPPPIPSELALVVGPALVDVYGATESWEEFNRCTLLAARLLAEAAPDPSPVVGVLYAGERLAKGLGPRLLADAVQRALGGQPLTREDAYSFACHRAVEGPFHVRGFKAPAAAAGRTAMEFVGIVRKSTCLLFLACSGCLLMRGAVLLHRRACR
eukprot:COSAG02_NODE_7161_length_3146_cov_5.991371_5_plen_186_part_00